MIRNKYISMHGWKELPWYFGNQDKIHLAIWNCGMRPQSRFQMLKDIRITLRYGAFPIFVIKKGDVPKTTLYSIKECKEHYRDSQKKCDKIIKNYE